MMYNSLSILKKGLLMVFFSSALFGCGGMEKAIKKPPLSLSSPMAKESKPKEKQSWQELKKQKGQPFSQRIRDIETFIQANKGKEIALEAYLLKAKIFLKNKKYSLACSTYHKNCFNLLLTIRGGGKLTVPQPNVILKLENQNRLLRLWKD